MVLKAPLADIAVQHVQQALQDAADLRLADAFAGVAPPRVLNGRAQIMGNNSALRA